MTVLSCVLPKKATQPIKPSEAVTTYGKLGDLGRLFERKDIGVIVGYLFKREGFRGGAIMDCYCLEGGLIALGLAKCTDADDPRWSPWAKNTAIDINPGVEAALLATEPKGSYRSYDELWGSLHQAFDNTIMQRNFPRRSLVSWIKRAQRYARKHRL